MDRFQACRPLSLIQHREFVFQARWLGSPNTPCQSLA